MQFSPASNHVRDRQFLRASPDRLCGSRLLRPSTAEHAFKLVLGPAYARVDAVSALSNAGNKIGNEYLQSAAPWTVFKEDPERAAAIIRLALNLIRVYAVLSAPFIPRAAASMLSAMNTLDTGWPDDMKEALVALHAGHAFSVPDVLFQKISDEERDDWAGRFAGVRT